MKTLLRPALVALSLAAVSMVHAQAPDNTRQNAQDSTNKAATADHQKNDKTDLMLTRQIRKSLVADKTLSTYAHNIKVVSVDGNVTLNGVVRTNEEKASVEAKARSAAGSGSVTSNLKVSP